jgi:hypothetical protein
MKKTFCMAMVALVLVIGIPASGFTSSVVDTVGWIDGIDSIDMEFYVDVAPQTYTVTLSDLNWTSYTGFDLLTLSISSSTETLAVLTIIDTAADLFNESGSVNFTVENAPDTLFASILGIGSGSLERGKFGIDISPSVPVPATVLLLGSGLVALTALRRRKL